MQYVQLGPVYCFNFFTVCARAMAHILVNRYEYDLELDR